LGEVLISRHDGVHNKSRTSRLNSPNEGGRKTPFNDSFNEDLASQSDIELNDHEQSPMKINFDLPKLDKEVIKMLELDPSEDLESKLLNIFYDILLDFGSTNQYNIIARIATEKEMQFWIETFMKEIQKIEIFYNTKYLEF